MKSPEIEFFYGYLRNKGFEKIKKLPNQCFSAIKNDVKYKLFVKKGKIIPVKFVVNYDKESCLK